MSRHLHRWLTDPDNKSMEFCVLCPAERNRTTWKSERGRSGALAALSRHDHTAINDRARQVYRASFRDGHGCSVCPRVDIPVGLTEDEITVFAAALRHEHYQRLGRLRQGKTRKNALAHGLKSDAAAEAISRSAAQIAVSMMLGGEEARV